MRSRTLGAFHLSVVFWFGLLLLALLPSLAPVCYSQGEASMQGTASDSSGGAIPGAAIRIKNVETGAERNQVTDEAGRYYAAALPAGRYEVRAEKTGFRSQDKIGISLVLGQRETVDLVLQVGDVQQRVGGIVPHGHDLRMCVTQRINREPAEKIQVPFALLVV